MHPYHSFGVFRISSHDSAASSNIPSHPRHVDVQPPFSSSRESSESGDMRRHGCRGISILVGLSEKRSISRPFRDRFRSSKTLTLGRVGTLPCCFAGMHDPARIPWFFRSDDRDRRFRDGCDTIAMQVKLQRCFFVRFPAACLADACCALNIWRIIRPRIATKVRIATTPYRSTIQKEKAALQLNLH